eukprot:9492150-Pyramimonas_sp.AAC.1
MATLEEFELACPDCDGPGLYAIQDGHRLRAGVTSKISRFARRQRTPFPPSEGSVPPLRGLRSLPPRADSKGVSV